MWTNRPTLPTASASVVCIGVPPRDEETFRKLGRDYGYKVDLLSASLTIPLAWCYINSFRRASSGGEAMARRRKEERRAGLASRGMGRGRGGFPPLFGPLGGPACGVVPGWGHSSGAAGGGCRGHSPGAARA